MVKKIKNITLCAQKNCKRRPKTITLYGANLTIFKVSRPIECYLPAYVASSATFLKMFECTNEPKHNPTKINKIVLLKIKVKSESFTFMN